MLCNHLLGISGQPCCREPSPAQLVDYSVPSFFEGVTEVDGVIAPWLITRKVFFLPKPCDLIMVGERINIHDVGVSENKPDMRVAYLQVSGHKESIASCARNRNFIRRDLGINGTWVRGMKAEISMVVPS